MNERLILLLVCNWKWSTDCYLFFSLTTKWLRLAGEESASVFIRGMRTMNWGLAEAGGSHGDLRYERERERERESVEPGYEWTLRIYIRIYELHNSNKETHEITPYLTGLLRHPPPWSILSYRGSQRWTPEIELSVIKCCQVVTAMQSGKVLGTVFTPLIGKVLNIIIFILHL